VFLNIVAGPAVTESRAYALLEQHTDAQRRDQPEAQDHDTQRREDKAPGVPAPGAEQRKVRQGRTYHPRVQFTTADGRTVEFTAEVGFSREPLYGGAVPVRYRRDDPEQAVIDRASSWMLEAGLWGLTGLGMLVAAVVVYVG